MSTITINSIPARLKARLESSPSDMEKARQLLLIAFDEVEEEDYQLTPDDIESLRRGAADIDSGRISDGPTNMTKRFEKIQQRIATQNRSEG